MQKIFKKLKKKYHKISESYIICMKKKYEILLWCGSADN